MNAIKNKIRQAISINYFLIIALLSITNIVQANTVTNNNSSPYLSQQLKPVGQGIMRWLFMDIYQISLYTQTGEYKPKHYPQVLSIHYQRSIEQQSLIDATSEQWQQQKLSANLYQPWLDKLQVIWPDINNGDRLTLYVSEDGKSDFYHNQQLLGSIDSANFSEAFLGIWLAKNTTEPSLRKQLIGELK